MAFNNENTYLFTNSIFEVIRSNKKHNKKSKREISFKPVLSDSFFIKAQNNNEFHSYEKLKMKDFDKNYNENTNDKSRKEKLKKKIPFNKELIIKNIQEDLNCISCNNFVDEKTNDFIEEENIIPEFIDLEFKITIQENFDMLFSLVNDLIKLIIKINNSKSNLNVNLYYTQLKPKIKKILNLIDKIYINLKEYNEKVTSLNTIFIKIYNNKSLEKLYKTFNPFKKIYEHEYKIYKRNLKIFKKIKNSIPKICDQILIDIENNKKLIEVEKEIEDLIHNK